MYARWRSSGPEHGAAAVELALVLPLLLLFLSGLVDFGLAYFAKISVNSAARDGARWAALGEPLSDVQARVVAAAPSLPLGGSAPPAVTAFTACPNGGGNGSVTVSYTYRFITPLGAVMGFFGGGGPGTSVAITSTGVMRCEV
ncbi:MAG: TadE/TadG family type IV pilus assembly protein [Motilibacteraceae bacterium]